MMTYVWPSITFCFLGCFSVCTQLKRSIVESLGSCGQCRLVRHQLCWCWSKVRLGEGFCNSIVRQENFSESKRLHTQGRRSRDGRFVYLERCLTSKFRFYLFIVLGLRRLWTFSRDSELRVGHCTRVVENNRIGKDKTKSGITITV